MLTDLMPVLREISPLFGFEIPKWDLCLAMPFEVERNDEKKKG